MVHRWLQWPISGLMLLVYLKRTSQLTVAIVGAIVEHDIDREAVVVVIKVAGVVMYVVKVLTTG